MNVIIEYNIILLMNIFINVNSIISDAADVIEID